MAFLERGAAPRLGDFLQPSAWGMCLIQGFFAWHTPVSSHPLLHSSRGILRTEVTSGPSEPCRRKAKVPVGP